MLKKKHRFLKPETIKWMKSKGTLNESEAKELIADLEAYRKKVESLQTQLDAKLTFINNGWEEERYVLQQQNKQLIEAVLESIYKYGTAYGYMDNPVKRLEDWEDDLESALQQIQGKEEER